MRVMPRFLVLVPIPCVLMLMIGGPPPDPAEFRFRCSTIYGDLRGYLMGQDLEDMKSR